MIKPLLFLLTLAHFIMPPKSFGQDMTIIPIKENMEQFFRLDKELLVFGDTTNYFSLDSIFLYAEPIHAFEKPDPALPFYWTKIILKNRTGSNLDFVITTNEFPVKRLYVLEEDGFVQKQESGYSIPLKKKAFPNYDNYFIINLHKSEQKTLIFTYQKLSSFHEKPDPFFIEFRSKDLTLGQIFRQRHLEYAFLAVIFVMALYNLILFLFIRQISYLWYVLAISFFGIYYVFQSGLGFEFILGDFPLFYYRGGIYPIMLSMIFTTLFTRTFLNTEQILPKWDRFLKYYVWLYAIPFCSLFIHHFTQNPDLSYFAQQINLSITFFLIIFNILIGYKTYKRKSRQGLIYLVAFSLLALSGAIYVATFIFTNFNLLTSNFLLIGYMLQTIFFSLGLADRINQLRKEINQQRLEKERLEKEKAVQWKSMLEEQNQLLEYKVEERTLQISRINNELYQTIEELNSSNEMLNHTNAQMEEQKKNLELVNKKITDSIRYARTIQKATLPNDQYIHSLLPNSFVLFKPRDIVSGDFYWFGKQDEKIIIAAIDCTGHGVPGAFMSMIANDLLNEIINHRKITHPGKILSELHIGVRAVLKQSETSNNDGMEMAICTIDPDKKSLLFAGAKNPLFYFAQNQLHIIKGDRYSIGGYLEENVKDFTTHKIQLSSDMIFYLFSDGYQDQFSENGKKLMLKGFKQILIAIHQLPMEEQKVQLSENFKKWKGAEEQVDDMLIIGFKLTP
jgi:two-component system, sensor histidine kinase LadS